MEEQTLNYEKESDILMGYLNQINEYHGIIKEAEAGKETGYTEREIGLLKTIVKDFAREYRKVEYAHQHPELEIETKYIMQLGKKKIRMRSGDGVKITKHSGEVIRGNLYDADPNQFRIESGKTLHTINTDQVKKIKRIK